MLLTLALCWRTLPSHTSALALSSQRCVGLVVVVLCREKGECTALSVEAGHVAAYCLLMVGSCVGVVVRCYGVGAATGFSKGFTSVLYQQPKAAGNALLHSHTQVCRSDCSQTVTRPQHLETGVALGRLRDQAMWDSLCLLFKRACRRIHFLHVIGLCHFHTLAQTCGMSPA